MKLIFTTCSIPVVEMQKATNVQQVTMLQDQKTPIITDFMLRITNPDTAYNQFEYNCTNYNRKIMVRNMRTNIFNVAVHAETADGYRMQLNLKPGCYAVILLAFMSS